VRFYLLNPKLASKFPLLFSLPVEPLFYLLAALQIAAGLYLIWQALQWLKYVRQRMGTDPGFFAPRVALLCPCKGLEAGLERNLVALTEFDHQNYEIFFILASDKDPAGSIVKRVAANSRPKAHVVIAGPPEGCSEKINNLRVAIGQLPPEFEVFVFADSDGRPGKAWLHRMVAPLNDGRISATTTMRWFMPNNNGLATTLLAAWNAPVVTMLSENGPNFCWGGGTAVRRKMFEEAGVLEWWQGSVSDDYSMTRALERTGRPILFVPECLTLSFVQTDFAGLLEFTNRQILITRVYAEKIWRLAALTHFLYCATFLLGVYLTLDDVLATRPAFHLATLTFLPLLLSAIRGGIRVVGVTEALPAWRKQISAQSWIYILINAFVPFLYVMNFVHSLVTRRMRWRGIEYELLGQGQTRIVV
jgi:cellulose synthase/poly-beta-1,6-N-acetylglucosamine synthase-like glycosyltransferase